MGDKMTTVHDVARYAGVSTASVSRVLNNYEHVSPDVLAKVQRAIEQLGYTPNSTAKSLRTLKSSKIIVSVPDIANVFFSNIIRSAEEAASVAGYAMLLGDVGFEGSSEEAYASLLKRREADGIIFLGHGIPPSLREMLARMGARAPIVNACDFSENLGLSSVHIDNMRAAIDVMNYLYSLGHRRIGIITGSMDSPISKDRRRGSEISAQAHGHADSLHILTGDYTIDSGATLATELLALIPRPTAIFCFSDDMAIGALYAARLAGIDCPTELSVVGFDDVKYARFAQPALTTIRQPMHEIGRRAVELLIGIIEGRIDSLVNITLEHSLVVRETTGPAFYA